MPKYVNRILVDIDDCLQRSIELKQQNYGADVANLDKNDFLVTTFYDFIKIDDVVGVQTALIEICNAHSLKGTIILAHEGFNSTICGLTCHVEQFKLVFNQFLIDQFKLASDYQVEFKDTQSQFLPFSKMKVRVRPEIVTMKVDNVDMSMVGEYLDSTQWDNMINDPQCKLIDCRNTYEVKMGSFKNAIDPETNYFRDFPQWVSDNLTEDDKGRKIAMFCTGGIRCEKSTAYLKQNGFKHVYHLKGGIIKYLLDTKNTTNSWIGKCFIFDDRGDLDDQLCSTREY